MDCMTIKECKETHSSLMNELTDIKVAIAELPEKILEKTDNRYASKSVEDIVNKLNEKSNNRTFEWLRAIVIAIVSAGLSLLIYKLK